MISHLGFGDVHSEHEDRNILARTVCPGEYRTGCRKRQDCSTLRVIYTTQRRDTDITLPRAGPEVRFDDTININLPVSYQKVFMDLRAAIRVVLILNALVFFSLHSLTLTHLA